MNAVENRNKYIKTSLDLASKEVTIVHTNHVEKPHSKLCNSFLFKLFFVYGVSVLMGEGTIRVAVQKGAVCVDLRPCR
jgi:hypothetical protein